MGGLFSYKHKNKKQLKARKDFYSTKQTVEVEQKQKSSIDEMVDLLERNENMIIDIKKRFNKKNITNISPIFDQNIIGNAEILHNLLKEHIPDLPAYTDENPDGSKNVSLRALIDAKDYLRNEFDIDFKDILNNRGDGLKDQMFYNGGFTIKPDGVIYRHGEKVFDPTDKELNKVYAIDFPKMIISIEPGIHVPFAYLMGLTKSFSNFENSRTAPGSEATNPVPGESEYEWRSHGKANSGKNGRTIVDPLDNPFYNELIIKNPLIGNDLKRMEFNNNLDEIMRMAGINNYSTRLSSFVTSPKFNPDYSGNQIEGTSTCNMKNINYFWLMFLLLMGGGNYKAAPLPGTNNQYAHRATKVDFFLCERKNYQTGHPMMYSAANKQGLPTSLLQIIYKVVSPPALIINVPALGLAIPFSFQIKKWSLKVKWKSFNIFKGMCILGFLEHFLFWLQELISDEIRKMFKCDMEYLTPVTNPEGVGMEFMKSSEPVCTFLNRDLNVCVNKALPASTRNKAGFYFCSKSDNCPKYDPDIFLYKSNSKGTGVTKEDAATEGSAVGAIIGKKNTNEKFGGDR